MNPCIVHKFYVTTETIARVETRSGDVLNNEESAGRRRATEINDPRSHGHRAHQRAGTGTVGGGLRPALTAKAGSRGKIQLAKLQKKTGFSQDRFAELAGLDRARLYRIETGQQQSMTLKTLKLIADALEVRATRLLRGY